MFHVERTILCPVLPFRSFCEHPLTGASMSFRCLPPATVVALSIGCGAGKHTEPANTCANPPPIPDRTHESPGLMSLMSLESATAIAGQSGAWSDPCTWTAGIVPQDDAQVGIPHGITVTVDGELEGAVDMLGIWGTLRFDPTVDTRLQVGTVLSSMMGRLEIGTAEHPIHPEAKAELLFIDQGPIDRAADPAQISHGAVLMGPVHIHGSAVSHRMVLATPATAGDRALVFTTAPSGWRSGDRIVIAGTIPGDPESDEVRTIRAVDGMSVTLDAPLDLDHTPLEPDLDVHVAHLSRNVVIQSESDELAHRAHVMFMHNLDVQVHHARFHQLGRTDKRIQLDDWFFPDLLADTAEQGRGDHIRGRYSVHFHRGGVDPTSIPAHVEGCVVEDDPGWAYVNHSSHVDFVNNVSYAIVGGAFQTESGDEVGSFVGNIAVRTVNPDYPLRDPDTAPVDIRENTQDFAFQGDGFWLHGGGVALRDNVATGSSGHGFIFWTEGLREVDVGFDDQTRFLVKHIDNGHLLPHLETIQSWWVPIRAFENNTTYTSTKGLMMFYVHATLFEDITELTPEYYETVHSTFSNTTIWGVEQAGVDMMNSERVRFDGLRMVNDGNRESVGIVTDMTSGDRLVWDRVHVSGFGTGMIVPTQGDITISGGTWANETDFLIAPAEVEPSRPFDNRDLRIEDIIFADSPHFSSADILHFLLVGDDVLEQSWDRSNEEEIHRQFLIPDRVVVDADGFDEQRLYFTAQAPDAVPVPAQRMPAQAEGTFVDDVADRTNADLQDDLGLSFGGALAPDNARESAWVLGGLVSPTNPTEAAYPACMYIEENHPPANTFDDFDFYACWDAEGGMAGVVTAFDHTHRLGE